MKENEYNRKMLSAAKWSSISQIINKMIAPITNMILARLLAPEAFGVIATVQMITSFVSMFTDAGFRKYLIQHNFNSIKDKTKSINVSFVATFSLSIIIWIAIIVFKDSLANLVGNPQLGNVIAIACIQLPITSFSSIQTALYSRDLDYKSLFYVSIIKSLIPLLVTLPLAFRGFSYWSLIIGSIIGEIVYALLLSKKSKWSPSFAFDFSIFTKMISFSMWTLLESFSQWLTSWFDIFLIGDSFNQYYLGLYKNSLNMVNSLMALISAAIFPVLFSTLSRLQNNQKGFRNTYYDTQKFVAYLVFPLGIGLFLYRKLATVILFGDQWIEASNIVGIWALVLSFDIVFTRFNGEAYRAKGFPKISFFFQLLYLSVLIPASLFAKRFGFWPLVYTRALMTFVGIILGFFFMKRFLNFSITEMLVNTLKPAFYSVLMGIFSLILIKINDSVIWSVFVIFLSILFYLILVMIFSKEDFSIFINIISRRQKKN